MKKSLILFSLLFFFFTAGYAHAQSETAAGVTKTPRPTSAAKGDKAQRCSNQIKQIDELVTKFNADADHPRLQRMSTELAATIAKLKAKGYDTTQVEADLATLGTKTTSCRTAFASFISMLTATKGFVCGESDGQFAAALKAANADHKTNVEPVCQDARTYLDKTVRTDLQSLKAQIVKPTKAPKPTKEVKPTKTPKTGRVSNSQ